MNDELSQAMRSISRDQLYELWLRAKGGESLEGEEAILAQMMKEHTEYLDVWERLDKIGGNEFVVNGVNPILHVNMHAVIENQLEQNTPPEVRKALEGLLKRGASRHDAIHAIAYEFNMELFPVLKHARPFDDKAYKRRLEKITRGKR
jgi:5,10-methylenetetrahydrofolate reductase